MILRPRDCPTDGQKPNAVAEAVQLPQATEVAHTTTEAVEALLSGEVPHPVGCMRMAMEALETRWPNPSLDAQEILGALQANDPMTAPPAVRNLVVRAVRIHAFARSHATPESAFASLTGTSAARPLSWKIKPHGICIIGHNADLQVLNADMGKEFFRPAGISRIHSKLPAHDDFIALASSESKQLNGPEIFATHELAHIYISNTAVEGILQNSEKNWGNMCSVLAEKREIGDIDRLYTEVLEGYANGLLKHEMLARFWAEPDNLFSEMPTKGPMDPRYVFNSFSYGVPNPYMAIEINVPPKHEKAAKLYEQRRAEMGLPLSNKEFTDDQAAAMKVTRESIRLKCKSMREPYRIAYEQSVILLKQGLAQGLPLLDLIDVVIATNFLRLPDALSAFITKAKQA